MTAKAELRHFGQQSGHFLKKEWGRLLIVVLMAVFALAPLLAMLFSLSADDFVYMFADHRFYQSIGFSLLYSSVAAVVSVGLSLLIAFLLDRSHLKHKKVFVLLLTLPMLVPSISIGLGFRTFLGTSGFLDQITGLETSATGLGSLILSSIVLSFPTSFLIVYDAFHYEDKSVYDAARTLGISPISQFFSITIPSLKGAIISSFFASLSLIFSDYGLPMEVAGTIQTLPMYLYEQVNSTFEYGRAAIVGLFLLLPAIASFIVDIFVKESASEESSAGNMEKSKLFDGITLASIIVFSLLLFIPQLSFIALAFIKSFPNNMAFTWDNFSGLFKSSSGPGISRYVINSLEMSLLVGVIGTALAYLTAYFTSRVPGKLGKGIHFISVSSIAIPGIVLGVGYILMFKGTHGFFYGTMAILVVVNVIHFFGSPYLMAKDSLSKMNKEYENVGSTLGLSKPRIFFRVLIPNSIPTLIEMFSYFFLNSMVTISAVSFLCRYVNQPLAVLITNYEKTGNYAMQAVISFVIFGINVIAKCLFTGVSSVLARLTGKTPRTSPSLSRIEFNYLAYLEAHSRLPYDEHLLSNNLKISVSALSRLTKDLGERNLLQIDSNGNVSITEMGLKELEPYRVKRAIILAAGFGSRMAPVTLDTPKPLVKVHGKRIIEPLLDALYAKGITDIVLVRGYKKDQFDCLKEKYPTITFLDNTEFNVTNNISSLMRCIDYVDRCYILEADLLISNPNLIRKYEYETSYMGAKVVETDDWCFDVKKGRIVNYRMGGDDCYQAYGISFWNEEDSEKLRIYIPKLYYSHAGKENFWDGCIFRAYKNKFKIALHSCTKSDIVEIDNFSELVALDDSYANYPRHEEY